MSTPSRRGYAIAVLVVFGVAMALLRHRGAGLIDFQVYRLGGQTVLRAGDLYDAETVHHFLFTYPPFAAVMFAPLAWLPFKAGYVLWTGVNATALVAFIKVYFPRWATTELRLVTLALATACLEPIWQNFFLGQIDLVLALAVSVDLLTPVGRRGRGLLAGLAIGIKLTPAIFLPLLLLLGQRRAARNVVVGFATTVGLALLVAPAASGTYWFHDVFAAGRVGDQTFANNQSVLAALLRMLHGVGSAPFVRPVWLLLALALGSAGVAVGRAWWRRGEPRLALAATALGGLLASPVSWTHHWVWCLPLGAGLVVAARRAGLSTVTGLAAAAGWTVAFIVAPTLWLPRHGGRELRWTVLQTLAGNTYLWLAIAALGYLTYLASRTSRARPAAVGEAIARGTPKQV